MTTLNGISPAIIDHYWAGLSPDHPDLVYALAERMEAMLLLPPEERNRTAGALLDLEAGLPDAALRLFLAAELRALTTLPAEGARDVLAAFDALTGCQKGSSAMRRSVAMQAASRDLSLDEISHLEPALPAIRQMAGLPPAKTSSVETAGTVADPAPESGRHKRWSLSRLLSRE